MTSVPSRSLTQTGHQLPASVRLALWTTHAWRHAAAVPDVLPLALPDVDHVAGAVDLLTVWRDFGETAVLVALPAPGDLAGMPRTSPDAVGAAVEAQECLFVPGIGGLLVPRLSVYGDPSRGGADTGTRLDLTAYEADPVPRHRVEGLDLRDVESALREQLTAATAALHRIGGRPFADRAARELADAALGGRWGLPEGLPARVLRVLTSAATIGTVCDLALDGPQDALSGAVAQQREDVLRALRRKADRALADATNVGCAVVAGWRPA